MLIIVRKSVVGVLQSPQSTQEDSSVNNGRLVLPVGGAC